ncbi:MAG: MmgE/PrpD family protein [Lautropia sp.]
MSRWTQHVEAIRASIECRIGRSPSAPIDRHARLIVLDTLGCALAGRRAPEVAALEARSADLEGGAFAFPGGRALGLRAATQVLAIGPTWHEACEGHAFAHGRPGIATFAALLPLALARGATLDAFIGAFVLGYEVGARAGGWLRVQPGLHVDGNWPGLGVAAGAAALLGADARQAMNAVDIAACQLPSSLYLPIRTGRSVRNGYLAHSASLGLDAAFASLSGFDAPPDALAWYADHLCRPATGLPDPATDLVADAYLKPFAAVRHVHFGALAARRVLRRLRESAGESAGDPRERSRADPHAILERIDAITLSVYEEATTYCSNPRPATPLAAQFSLSFGLAAMLRFDALDAASYDAPRFDDPVLRRLEALVQVRVDDALTRDARRGATLSVRAGTLEASAVVRGDDPALQLDADGAIRKFAANASHLVGRAPAAAWASEWLDAERERPLAAAWSSLAAQAAATPRD